MPERPFSSSFDVASSTLTVAGVIDTADEPDFALAIADGMALSDEVLTIDLSEVEFLPSSALGVLVNATRRDPSAPDGSRRTFELVAAPGSIAARVLEMVGFPHRPG